MSYHVGQTHTHTKRRGKIRRCDWCGQNIEIRETYATWLFFDNGKRDSVYAHIECADEWEWWASEEGDVIFSDGNHERPSKTMNNTKPVEPTSNA